MRKTFTYDRCLTGKNVITSFMNSERSHSGDHRWGVTHVPFPNTLVKPSTADGSAATLLCESRSSPVYTEPVQVTSLDGLPSFFESWGLSAKAFDALEVDGKGRNRKKNVPA